MRLKKNLFLSSWVVKVSSYTFINKKRVKRKLRDDFEWNPYSSKSDLDEKEQKIIKRVNYMKIKIKVKIISLLFRSIIFIQN